MITRVIKQLQTALPRHSVYYFSGSDKFKKRERGEKGLFSGKNKNQEQISKTQQQHKSQVHSVKQFEPQKFLHKQQKSDNQSAFKKKSINQEQKIILKVKKSQKIEDSNLKLRKVLKEEEEVEEVRQNASRGQQKQDNLSQQIITKLRLQNQGKIEMISGTVQQEVLVLQKEQVYITLSQDSHKLLELFDNKNWQAFSSLLRSYQSLLTPQKIIDYIHPIVINRSPAKYIEWLTSTHTDISYLSDKIIRKVFNKLIDCNQYESVKLWTKALQTKCLDIGYEFLDIIFSEVDKNASLVILKAQIPPKIQISLLLLEFIEKNKPIIPKYPLQTVMSQNDGYLPGSWLPNLWYIAKQRHLFLIEFIQIFQKLAITHQKKINLIEMHANGLFLDVLQSYYFGSHLTSTKFNQLFALIYEMHDFQVFVHSFRQSLMQYKIKTGKNPFPNVNNCFQQLTNAIAEQNIKKALFFYQLCIIQGRKQPFSIFNGNYELLKAMRKYEDQVNILKDGLLSASKESLKSQKKNQKGKQKIKSKQYQPSILTYSDITKMQSFFYINKDKQRISNFACNTLGLNRQQMYNLANRNKDQTYRYSFNQKKIKAGNYIITEDGHNQQYFLSQNEETEQVQTMNENKQLKQDNEEQKQTQQQFQQEESSSVQQDNKHPFVQKISQFYKNQLKIEGHQQENFMRKEVLKILRLSKNPLDATKAAIKLDKPQLAWTIFKHKIMREIIKQRTLKNIDYVVRAFVLQHCKDNKELNKHEIIDSLNRFNFNFLDKIYKDSFQTEKEQWILANTSFLESIYQKLQNFDHLVWQKMPNGNLKHEFWQSTLVLQRAEQLSRLESQGKLNDFKYQKEHFNFQPKKVDQLFPKQMSWRNQLIYGLGIQSPEQRPIQGNIKAQNFYLKYQNKQQLRQYILDPLIQLKCPPVKIKSNQQTLLQEKQQTAQGEQVAAQGQAAVQGEVAQTVQGQGQQLQAQQHQQSAFVQQTEHTKIQQQPINNKTKTVKSIYQYNNQLKSNEVEKKTQSCELMGQTIYEHSQKNKIKGYDFYAFMEINRAKLKPFYEKLYEQQEKVFKKYFLALQALVQEAYIHDNHSLQKKLQEVQDYLKNPQMIAKMVSFDLWNFDFVTVREPSQYLERTNRFRQNFYSFKKYMGDKMRDSIPNLSKQKIYNFYEIMHNRRVTKDLVEELLIKRHPLFKEAEAVVKIQPREEVQQIILWGLFNDEPLAIYMGQKLAMLTNQKISHKLALLVARYLSHKNQVPEERVERCKEALKVVGRINRQHIYEMSKDYEHITVRNHLKTYIEKRQKELDSSALLHLTKLQPTYSTQDTTFNLKRKISRGNLTL